MNTIPVNKYFNMVFTSFGYMNPIESKRNNSLANPKSISWNSYSLWIDLGYFSTRGRRKFCGQFKIIPRAQFHT